MHVGDVRTIHVGGQKSEIFENFFSGGADPFSVFENLSFLSNPKKNSQNSKNASSGGTQNVSLDFLEIFVPKNLRGIKVTLSESSVCDIEKEIMENVKGIAYTSFSGSQKDVRENEEVWTRFSGRRGVLEFNFVEKTPTE
ncbi:MAG: hypothetical protein ACRCYZ_02600 [Alphaproteobacteria bacterium]